MKIRKIEEKAPDFTARHFNQYPFQVTVITPIYGGGVKAGKPDQNLPVRATAIRGQLRFWWRILNRQKFMNSQGEVDHQKLFAAESAIWGKMSEKKDGLVAKRVKIRVNSPKIPDSSRLSPIEYKGNGQKYALFSAISNSHKVIKEGLTFTLIIECADDLWHSDIERTLRFWASFGGLGARSRRGLGSLEMKELKPVKEAEAEAVGCQLIKLTPTTNAIAAWNTAIARLQRFRQVEVGRASNSSRSRWPEPDAIRRILNTHCLRHPPEHEAGNVFPRAAFGLPIIFKFKDDGDRDPSQSSLQPKDFERLASPLILKAMALGNGQYAPIALRLPELEITGKALQLNNREITAWWPTDPDTAKTTAEKVKPLQNRTQNGDVLSAFLNFFQKGS